MGRKGLFGLYIPITGQHWEKPRNGGREKGECCSLDSSCSACFSYTIQDMLNGSTTYMVWPLSHQLITRKWALDFATGKRKVIFWELFSSQMTLGCVDKQTSKQTSKHLISTALLWSIQLLCSALLDSLLNWGQSLLTAQLGQQDERMWTSLYSSCCPPQI